MVGADITRLLKPAASSAEVRVELGRGDPQPRAPSIRMTAVYGHQRQGLFKVGPAACIRLTRSFGCRFSTSSISIGFQVSRGSPAAGSYEVPAGPMPV